MAVKWCDQKDVERRLKHIQSGKNHDATAINEAIEDAVEHIKPVLLNKYGADKVAEWNTQQTAPPSLRKMTADFAGAFVLQNHYGQSITDEISKASSSNIPMLIL